MRKRQFGGFSSKEEELAYKAAWRAKNKAKVADYMRSYRERHPQRDHHYYEQTKEARKKQTKAWRLANPKKRQAYLKDWLERHPLKAREYRLRHKWKLSIEQWNAMWAAQDGRCAICGLQFDLSVERQLNVDHCHKTGRIRELLCNQCNQGGGQFRDDPRLLRLAADYFEKHAARFAAEDAAINGRPDA